MVLSYSHGAVTIRQRRRQRPALTSTQPILSSTFQYQEQFAVPHQFYMESETLRCVASVQSKAAAQ